VRRGRRSRGRGRARPNPRAYPTARTKPDGTWLYLDAEVLVLPPAFLPQDSVFVGCRSTSSSNSRPPVPSFFCCDGVACSARGFCYPSPLYCLTRVSALCSACELGGLVTSRVVSDCLRGEPLVRVPQLGLNLAGHELAFTRYCFTSKLYCESLSSFCRPPPTCKAYPIAILLHDHCAIYAPPPNPLFMPDPSCVSHSSDET